MRDVLGVKELKIRTQTLTNPYQQKYFYQKKEEKLNCVCLAMKYRKICLMKQIKILTNS